MSAGRPIAQICADLGISDQTIHNWRKQDRIDTGQMLPYVRFQDMLDSCASADP